MLGFVAVGVSGNGTHLRRAAVTSLAAKKRSKKKDGKGKKDGQSPAAPAPTDAGVKKDVPSAKGFAEVVPPAAEPLKDMKKAKDQVLAKYGLYESSGSTTLQKKADEMKRAEQERLKDQVTNYEKLVNAIGLDNIGTLEKVLTSGGAVFLGVIILTGIAIGVEAFFKATGKAVPDQADSYLVTAVSFVFTPSLLLFFACSVSLGLLKSAQIDQANKAIIADQKRKQGKE